MNTKTKTILILAWMASLLVVGSFAYKKGINEEFQKTIIVKNETSYPLEISIRGTSNKIFCIATNDPSGKSECNVIEPIDQAHIIKHGY